MFNFLLPFKKIIKTLWDCRTLFSISLTVGNSQLWFVGIEFIENLITFFFSIYLINSNLLSDVERGVMELHTTQIRGGLNSTGYYTKKYYNTLDCSGPLNFIEGYATGLCLASKNGTSVVLTGRSKDYIRTLHMRMRICMISLQTFFFKNYH